MPKNATPLTDQQREVAAANIGLLYARFFHWLERAPSLRRDEEELFSQLNTCYVRAIRGFRPEFGFALSTYVTRSIDRGVYSWFRKLKRMDQRFSSERDHELAFENAVDAQGLPPDSDLIDEEDRELFRQWIDQLPQRERDIIALRMQRLTYREIGRVLCVSHERIRLWYFAAIERCRGFAACAA